MGCGRMSPALLLLLSLASCSPLQGTLLRPRHVMLEAQNFHVWLRWEPDPSSPSYATYEVEWRNRIHDLYWARVRVVAGGEQSEWASSSELQLYRDTIVGPPKLSWLLQDQMLSVNIITPLTPYRRRSGSYKRVDRVLLKLWYWLHLYEGNLLVQQVPCRRSRQEAPCTLGLLKPSTQYCVRTAAAELARERSREVQQCLVTPAAPAGFPWVLAVPIAFFLLLLSAAGLCFVHLHVLPTPAETRLPEALALRSPELGAAVRVPALPPEEPPALLLPAPLPSRGPPGPGQASAAAPRLPPAPGQDGSGYCANGFGPDCPEVSDPSCAHSRLGHALASRVPSQLEKDGDAGDGDDLPEQLVLAGLTGNSYTGDRDSQIPERWPPPHLQLYSKCQCPVLGAGSRRPLPVPSRSCSREYPRDSLGTAECWVRLSSVKLPEEEEEEKNEEEEEEEKEKEKEVEEEEGGQLRCAPPPLPGGGTELEPAEPGVPCQPPRGPRSAVPFSGYEPRLPSGGHHGQRGPPAAPGSRQSPEPLPELPCAGRPSQVAAAGMGMRKEDGDADGAGNGDADGAGNGDADGEEDGDADGAEDGDADGAGSHGQAEAHSRHSHHGRVGSRALLWVLLRHSIGSTDQS